MSCAISWNSLINTVVQFSLLCCLFLLSAAALIFSFGFSSLHNLHFALLVWWSKGIMLYYMLLVDCNDDLSKYRVWRVPRWQLHFYFVPVWVGVRSVMVNLSVCLSVCPRAYFSNRCTDLHEILCADPLWQWFGPPLVALRYVVYFRFYGWCHVWS